MLGFESLILLDICYYNDQAFAFPVRSVMVARRANLTQIKPHMETDIGA
jgi:hypothetical protein